MISLLGYCPFKESFLVFYISLFCSSILLAWLVKKYLFGLISHRTLSLSVLRRKFPTCVAPSWCYIQGMVCRLQQIGGLDGFEFICLQSEAHGGRVTSRAHRHRQRSHERVTSVVFEIFVHTCFTTVVLVDVLTWLLNSSASGRSKGKSRTTGLKKIQQHGCDNSD